MKTRTSVLFVIILLTALLYSCYNDHGYNSVIEEPFRIKVDNFTFSGDTLSITDTLTIYFEGTIGSDTCHLFSHFQFTKEDHRADLAAWGVHRYKLSDTCKKTTTTLDGVYFKLYPFAAGDFSVVIHQPNGDMLSKSVFIK